MVCHNISKPETFTVGPVSQHIVPCKIPTSAGKGCKGVRKWFCFFAIFCIERIGKIEKYHHFAIFNPNGDFNWLVNRNGQILPNKSNLAWNFGQLDFEPHPRGGGTKGEKGAHLAQNGNFSKFSMNMVNKMDVNKYIKPWMVDQF